MDTEKKSNGATVGMVVIILILIVGGIYTWKVKVKQLADKDQVLAPITVEDSEELEALLKELGTANADTEFNVDEVE